MSMRANPKIIGAFVVGAVILAVTGVLIFGTGKFLTKKNFFVLYFDGSVSGLDVGAPVEFRGVRVGTVHDIKLYLGGEEEDIRVPVTIQIIPVSITGADVDREKYRELMIKRGLRAQLQTQSLVTGKLKIAFGYHPDTPVKLSGLDSEYPELPTIPSTIEQWSKKIENLPIEELIGDALKAIKGINNLVNSPELIESIGSLRTSLAAIERVSNKLEKLPVEELSENTLKAIQGVERIVNAPELMESINSLNQTLKDVKDIVHNVKGQTTPLIDSIKKTSETARASLETAQEALYMVKDFASGDSPLQYELISTLRELSSAARSLRVAADYLEQHPEALLYGKGGQKGK